jgi:hypothetical protein
VQRYQCLCVRSSKNTPQSCRSRPGPRLQMDDGGTGTFQTHADKELTDQRRQFIRLASIAKHRHGSVVKRAASRCDQFANKLIPRLSFMKRLSNPAIIIEGRLDADVIRIWTQQVGPFVRPVISEFRFQQQSIHKPGTFVGRFVGKKICHFILTVGIRPQISVVARRRNVWSSQTADGVMFRLCNFCQTRSSMKLFFGN